MKVKSNRVKSWTVWLIMAGILGSCSGNKNTKADLPVVEFQQEPGKLFILIDKKPFATYVYEDSVTTRPYFENVMTPCGVQATRNHPVLAGDPKDHSSWHPGIWLSYGDLNGVDYWRLEGKVEHELFTEQPKGGAGKGTFTVRNYYMSADGKERMVAELVRYSIIAEPSGYLLTSASTYSSEKGDFTFGDQEEMGLGIRVNTKITVQYGDGHITNAEGQKDEDGTWGKASKWIDYSGEIDDHYVGMAIMQDPANFRPAWFHSRNYGYIAANPFGREAMKQGEKSAVTVKKGDKFSLGFGVLVYCTPKGEQVDINDAYQDYLNDLKE